MWHGCKIILRPFTHNDLESMVRWNNDPEVERFVDCDLPKTIGECRQWFSQNGRSLDYRIYALEDGNGRLIGDLELDHISWRKSEAELRIRIGEKEYWNKGYGTDAVQTLLMLAGTQLGLRHIYLRVYRFNQRAIRCYEKCGFGKEGILKRRRDEGGSWKDIVLMTRALERDQAARESAATLERH